MLKSFVFLFMLSLLSLSIDAILNYQRHNCSNTMTFTPNSTFQANLNLALSFLSSNATHNNIGFYNATAGHDPPDVAYANFLCRGNLVSQVCQECVMNASKMIVHKCPNNKAAMIVYDECTLRYSNRSFFSIVEEEPVIAGCNVENVMQTDPDGFMQFVGDTMRNLAIGATSDHSPGKKFAAKKASGVHSVKALYSVAQCTPDLSVDDCKDCLVNATDLLLSQCRGKIGGRVVLLSCNVRYELYPFYDNAAASSRGKDEWINDSLLGSFVFLQH
ncbi:hypothetical protein L1049_009659 [Liquidambar formosana]|uniref:Gnk2-homologous domain-containing protein n=1 Tax=Liquidambar formosana TaxID=63359 RepID=A0AAP0R0R8_LIQFO